jgi:hypothetical protein
VVPFHAYNKWRIHLGYDDIAGPLVCYSRILKLWRKRFAMAAPAKDMIPCPNHTTMTLATVKHQENSSL